ncbi:MAG: T9SS type A sorting domain-containing protein [Bacteroidota bacterium]
MNNFFILLFFLLLPWAIQAQNNTGCFNFQQLPRDTSFGVDTGTSPGDVVFSDANYSLRVDGFFFPEQNESEFYAASVTDNPFSLFPDVGRGLFLAAVSVSFESFTDEAIPKRAFFTIADGGGDKYLKINDEQTPFLGFWGELDGYIFEGGRIRVLQNHPDSVVSTVIVEGDIRELSIGGNEQFIYEYCEQPLSADFCRISNLQVKGKECISNERYILSVDFEYEGATADSFQVYIGGESISPHSFALENFPVEFATPFLLTDPFEATVCVDNREDCCATVAFRQPRCNDCAITFAEAYPEPCDSSGEYMVNLYVEALNGSTTGFFVQDVFSRTFGPFIYGDTLIHIGPFSDLGDIPNILTIIDAEEPNCIFETEIPPACSFNNCVIEEVVLEYQPCDDTGRFLLDVIVRASNGSEEGFFINYGGQDFGPFMYEDSTITVGPILAGGEVPVILEILDAENPSCFWSEFLSSPCQSACQLIDAQLYPQACNSSGAFFVEVFVLSEFPGTEFGITVNNEFYGSYPTEDSLFFVGPFSSNVDSIFDWRVFDLTNESCFVAGSFESPCLTANCESIALQAGASLCSDNEFNITLEVTDLEDAVDAFFVEVNGGTVYGPYDRAATDTATTIVIGPFPNGDALVYNLTVYSTTNRSCRANIRVTPPDCAAECSIQNFEVTIGEICNDDGTFPLTYTFDIDNPIGSGYDLLLDNNLLGRYPYGSTNLQFPNFSLDGRASATLAIVAGGDFSCAVRQDIFAPECSVDTSQVWPGDTNADGIANHFDLLNIGIGYGTSGPARTIIDTGWIAMDAPKWAASFPSGTNYKHADTDGNGFINDEDVNLIEQHYGLLTSDSDISTPDTDPDEVVATEGDPNIFVDLPQNGSFPVGSAFSVPIVLGSEDRSVESVYGIAFTINYDPNVIDANQLDMTVPSSWMGDDLLTIQKAYPQEGKVEMAISRTDGESVTGYGVVALMTGIIVDLVGLRTVEVEVSDVRAIKADFTRIPIFPDSRSTTVTTTQTIVPDVVTVFPNPTNGLLQWNVLNEQVENVEVLNLQGQVIQALDAHQQRADISHLSTGTYLLRIQTMTGYHHELIIKK